MEDKQVKRIHLLRGITRPNEEFQGWREAENVAGLGWRVVVLSIVSAIVAGIAGYVVTQVLHIVSQAPQAGPDIPTGFINKMTIGASVFDGLVGPIIDMLIMALIFLIFFSDIGYKKLFAIELYLQLISLIGAIVSGILMAILHSATKSFLNLGAITHLLTGNAFVNGFFGGISIFLIWKLYVQINAYRQASTKSSSTVIWTLIIINIVFLLIIGGVDLLSHQMKGFLQHMQQIQQPQ